MSITDNKIFAYIDRVFGERTPITADIFLNNYCNNRCPYCTYRRWEFDADAYSMPFEDFVKYATRLKELGVQGLILTGGGEPTISKDFDKIVGWLDDNDFHYGINTNFNVLKYFKPDYLKVSLDGWDNDSYADNRGVYKYDEVVANIIDYVEWKQSHSCNTSVGIQKLAKTVEDVEQFYEGNKYLPVDYISIRPMESISGSYYKNLPTDKNLQPAEIIKAINRIASLDKRVILNFKWNMLNVQEDCCTAQWAQIALNERGEVMYCCHKPYQIVGHIMDDDILEKKSAAGTNMSMCDIPCRMTSINANVSRMLNVDRDVYFL